MLKRKINIITEDVEHSSWDIFKNIKGELTRFTFTTPM